MIDNLNYKQITADTLINDEQNTHLNSMEYGVQEYEEQKNNFIADFNFIVAEFISGQDINSSIQKLCNKTSEDDFNSNLIDYQPEFINKLTEILVEFLESGNINFKLPQSGNESELQNDQEDGERDSLKFSLLINTITVISRIWTIKKCNETVFDEKLINAIFSDIEKFNRSEFSEFRSQIRDFNIESFKALVNLSSYFATLVSTFCTPEFFSVFNEYAYTSESFKFRVTYFEFLLIFSQNENVLSLETLKEFFSTILPQFLLDFFKADYIENTSKCLYNLLKKYGDESLFISLKSGLISKILDVLKVCDQTKREGCYNIISFCIDRLNYLKTETNPNECQVFILQNESEISDNFFSPFFVNCLISTLNQLFSESSFAVFNLIDLMMDQMWRIFFDEGLIEYLITEDAGLIHTIVFKNKIHCASCVTKFLEAAFSCVDEEEKKKLDFDEFCQNYGKKNDSDKYFGPVEYEEDEYNEMSEEKKKEENERSFLIKSLSNWKVVQCVVFGGGLSFLILMLNSLKDFGLIKRIFQLIYNLISTGPHEFAQLAYDENLLDNVDNVANQISELVDKNEDEKDILAIASQITQFYHKDE